MTAFRRTIAILSGAFGLLMGAVALTVPMVVATGPALLALTALAVAFVVWPRQA